MPNHDNLKRFRRGQSGNPNGRPKGSRNVSTALTEMLSAVAPDVVRKAEFVKSFARSRKKATIADAVAMRIVYEGVVNGQSWALKEICDRTEGKPRQSVKFEIPPEPTPVEVALRVIECLMEECGWSEQMAREFTAPRYLLNPEDIPMLSGTNGNRM